jgi:hypothetical protein
MEYLSAWLSLRFALTVTPNTGCVGAGQVTRSWCYSCPLERQCYAGADSMPWTLKKRLDGEIRKLKLECGREGVKERLVIVEDMAVQHGMAYPIVTRTIV